jgi:hypothetical protein
LKLKFDFLGEKQMKKAPPLSAANFGRRYRTRSLTRLYSIFYLSIKRIYFLESDTANFNSRRDSVPSTPSGLTCNRETPFSGLLGRTLSSICYNKNLN